MKICLISDHYYPHLGGIAEHMYHLGVELRKSGHLVKIITANMDGEDAPDESDVLRIGRSILIPMNRSFCRMTVGYNLSRKLRDIFSHYNFDIIHIHDALGPTLPLLALKYTQAIKFFTFHSGFVKSSAYSVFKKLLSRYFDKIDGLIAVSETAKRCTYPYFPGQYKVIPNGIDIDRFSPKVKGFEKFKSGGPSILFIGRFEPRKGLKYLLQAFPVIHEQFPDSRLIVVGKGRLKGYSFKNGICFERTIPPETIPKYYASCDVFCSPATGGESFGIVLLEAMASGKPVIASDILGYNDVITNERDGLLVEPKNPKAIADAVIRIFTNSDLRNRLSKQGRETALKYSWDKVTKRIENFYYEVADKRLKIKY
ncbi:glycosyltransferase family 4 protein [candidate division WOR-3 bacterium]|nr:glycosyltransferase family 4 protein [candidate division WOR-3 bacterium]